jgi:isoleucyl-tRNA synthetase
VYNADFVTAESGTGIAHEAPTFGADDWALLKKVNLPFVQHVTMDGTFKPEVKDFAGMEVKPNEDRTATDVEIIKHMSKRGTLFSKEKIEHSYPHCWRCDTPLLNYATSSWFVSVEKVKENLLKNAERITWSPAHIKEGRFGKWLEGARDWSISRQRFWASVIPIWICEKCKSKRVFGSAAELEEVSGKKIDDLHKHIVDEVTVMCECQGVMRRVPDVLDTWFDSGSMPYGERHYPFENKEQFDAVFPAQFIAEGVDQTRAWFYYLHVLGGALFSENAFQNVIVSGIVLAEDGKKMSKKLQNYPDPMEVIEKYGADAVRLYMLSSPVVRAESLNFTESGVGEIGRKVIDRLVNTYTFYALYKDAVAHTPHADSVHVLDRWIIARMQELSAEVTAAMDDYELDRAARPLIEFVDDLSTWYVRRSRDRFKGEDTSDASAALSTLSWVLREYAKHAAPFMPFITDWLWRELKHTDDVESVHLAHWPELGKPDTSLITAMGETRQVVSIALQQRAHVNMKVRQPLAKVIIPDASVAAGADREALFELIKDEVNVKAVETNTDKTFSVQLDTILTEDLIREGHIRDLLRAVQGLRKQSKLTPGAKAVLVARASTDALKTLVASAEPELARVANISEVQWLETSETHEDDESVKENTETIKFTDATLTITLK